jgi:hypothetical protein
MSAKSKGRREGARASTIQFVGEEKRVG